MAERPRLAALASLRGLAPLAAGLAIWQIAGSPASPYAPPPAEWLRSLGQLYAAGKLGPALAATLATFALGAALSTAIGFALGLLLGRSRAARRALGPLLEFCRGMPPPVLVPIAVLLLGYSENLKLVNVVWVAIWPVLLNTASAAARIDPLLIDACRSLHLRGADRVRKVIAPAVVPEFLTGLRVALPLAIIITLLVEMMTALPGVGSLIVTSQRQFRAAEVYGLLALVGAVGFVLNAAFALLERAILKRWPESGG